MTRYDECLRSAAGMLATLNSHAQDVARPIGFLVGACYALRMSLQFGWVDGSEKRADVDPVNYLAELTRVARWLSDSADVRAAVSPEVETPTSRWSAGFYYTNALMRIAAAAECLEVHHRSGTETEATKTVRRTVNVLKHELSTTSGICMPPMAIAIQALDDVLDACRTRGVVS